MPHRRLVPLALAIGQSLASLPVTAQQAAQPPAKDAAAASASNIPLDEIRGHADALDGLSLSMVPFAGWRAIYAGPRDRVLLLFRL